MGSRPYERKIDSIRRGHRASCLARLRDYGPATLTELARATGLSRPTIVSIVEELTADGLVSQEAGTATSGSAGRPARLVRFVSQARFILSINAAEDSLFAMMVDLAGRWCGGWHERIDEGATGSERIHRIRMLVDRALAETGVSAFRLHSLVLAVPAIVDGGGRVVWSEPIPQWTGVDLAAQLGARMPCPVIVENDVNMAVLAEHTIGAARLADNVLYFHLGERMAVGIVVANMLYRGAHHSAGEMWDLSIPTLPSRAANLDREQGRDAVIRAFASAGLGDVDGRQALSRFAESIGPAIASLTTAFDPDVVVIGGWAAAGGAAVLEAVQAQVVGRAGRRPLPSIISSGLGSRAVGLGGLVRGLEHVNTHLFGAPQLPVPDIATAAP